MLERSRATVEVLVRDEVQRAPRSSLNCEMGATRSFAVVRVPLADLKDDQGAPRRHGQRRRARGGHRRPAAAAGGSAARSLPAQGLRAMVPMNVRQASEQLALGNRISSLFVHLPVGGRDRAPSVTGA